MVVLASPASASVNHLKWSVDHGQSGDIPYISIFSCGIYAASTSIENAMVENLEDFSRLFFHNNRESAAGLE